MKAIDIALKDLTRSFRSAFLLVFMFAIPLLVTGMFYLMFGSMTSSDNKGFELPKTKVVIVNLDQGSPVLTQGMTSISKGNVDSSLGDILVKSLQSAEVADLMEISMDQDPTRARKIVDNQQAGVAIIIPTDFSTSFASTNGKATLQIYEDPTLTIGPRIVETILKRVTENFSNAKIAADVALSSSKNAGLKPDPVFITAVVVQSMTWITNQGDDPTTGLLVLKAPASIPAQAATGFLTSIVGPIMGGMMIFFAFFTGGATSQTILREDEEGTLARLFTTPTRQSTILGGKFMAVGLTVLVQITILLITAHLIFHIEWGRLISVILTGMGIILCAATFGIFLTSLLKNSRQGGVVFGGLMTVTGMLGMMTIFTGSAGNGANPVSTVSLLVPQGWAVRGLLLCMNGASVQDVALNLLILVTWSLVFFSIGVLRFQKRYA